MTYNSENPQTVMWFMLYTQVLQADGASYRNILLTHQQGTLMPDPPPILLQKTAELKLTPSGAPSRCHRRLQQRKQQTEFIL